MSVLNLAWLKSKGECNLIHNKTVIIQNIEHIAKQTLTVKYNLQKK